MRHLAARVISALALGAASVAIGAAPAHADVEGFTVRLENPPNTFTAEKSARTLTAVISTDVGEDCQKVRWTLVIRTEGISLDQLRVARVEDNRTFRFKATLSDNAAVLADEKNDPGELCRDRTVTGRWDIGFTGPDDGAVTFDVLAADRTGRVLSSASTSSQVVSGVAATVRPSPTESRNEDDANQGNAVDPGETDQAAGGNAAAPEPTGAEAAGGLTPASSGTPSVLGPGLIVGAVLVFLGVGLLMRMRMRSKRGDDSAWAGHTQALPTGFYTPPSRRPR